MSTTSCCGASSNGSCQRNVMPRRFRGISVLICSEIRIEGHLHAVRLKIEQFRRSLLDIYFLCRYFFSHNSLVLTTKLWKSACMRYSLITFALASLLPVAASATTYDLVSSFSTSNPSGQFTYGYGTPVSGNAYGYEGTNLLGTYAFTYFAISQDSLPAVGHGSSTVDTGTVDVPSSQLFLHPGNAAAQDSIVAFLAPTAGVYDVDVTFTHDDDANSGTGQFVGVYLNGSDLGSTLLTTTYGDSFTFDEAVTLAAGDFLVFDVAANGDYSYDSTGLAGTITSATPEPSSLVLLGSGVLGLAGAIRRKIRS